MNVKSNKGSITVFVLVGLLFMSAFLIISFGNIVNKSKFTKEQFNIMSSVYSHNDGDANAYERAYTELRKGTKQIMNSSSENSKSLELTKTYVGKISNYRIYGNSIQNGTPSPDNPVEIESVGDKINLLNNKDLLITDNTYEDWEITETGIKQTKLSTSGYLQRTLYDITDLVKPNTTYYFHIDIDKNFKSTNSTTESISGSLRLVIDDSVVKNIYTTNSTGNLSYTMPESFSKVEIKSFTVPSDSVIKDFDETKTYYFEWKNLYMSEKVYTEYEPHGKYRIPVKVSGKNLLDINQLLSAPSGIFDKHAVNNILTLKLKPNTYYTLSSDQYGSISGVSDTDRSLYFNGTDVNNSVFSGHPVTIKTDNTGVVNILLFSDRTNAQNIINRTAKILLEEGLVATEYEPYVEPQTVNIYLDEPLRKIGTESDYIDFSTGTVVRKIKELTLDGNTSWSKYNNSPYYGFSAGNILETKYSRPKGLSNMSQYIGEYYEEKYSNAMWLGVTNNYVYFLFTSYFDNTLEDYGLSNFKARLNEVPLRVYYESSVKLPTETVELPTLMAYEDYTKIEVLTEVTPSKIETEYTGYTFE